MSIGKNGDVNISAPIGTPKETIEAFIRGNSEWIDAARERTAERLSQRDDFFSRLPLATALQTREATRRLNDLIPPLIRKHAPAMGVSPKVVRYRATRSRLGSCRKSTGEITFSVYLLLLPEWLVEHVVVHELAHLIEPNHGPGFYQVMDRHFPRWKEARKATRLLMMQTPHDD